MKIRFIEIFSLIILTLNSCSLASNGKLTYDDNGCTILTNSSDSKKIVFVVSFTSKQGSYNDEITVGPKEESILTCPVRGTTCKIIGAYEKND